MRLAVEVFCGHAVARAGGFDCDFAECAILGYVTKSPDQEYAFYVGTWASGAFFWIHRGLTVARITVEDCLGHVGNRFELALAAAVRARQLVAGHQSLVDASKRDKPVVVALREIAAGKIDRSVLKKLGL